MGLAASQVRLLMLTGRKDDVEGGLMSLANQKLGLARKSADLSKDYSNALNATKLVWNNGGSTSSDVDLTYGLLMGYNTANQQGQFMLADNSGRAVLSDTYADKLLGSGVDSKASGKLAMSEQDFLVAMGFTSADATACVNSYGTNKTAGVTSKSSQYNDDDVWNYMKSKCTLQSLDSGGDYSQSTDSDYSGSSDKNKALVVRCSSQTVGDQEGLDTFLNNVIDDITEALGASIPNGINKSAIATATEDTKAHYQDSMNEADNGDGKLSSNGGQHTYKYESSSSDKVGGTNDIMESYNGTNTYFLDVNQLVKTFLNFYDGAVGEQAGSSDYQKYSKAVSDPSLTKNGGLGVTTRISSSSSSTTSGRSTGSSTASGGSTTTPDNFDKASFYLNLYEYAQNNGAIRNSSIDKDNGSYLQNQVQNGSIHLAKYGGNANWNAVSTSDEESLITSEADDSKATEAKAKYDSDKSELDYKEQQIDLQITNLDTERSALDTEVDSVKAILNKNIERSFKMFQNA